MWRVPSIEGEDYGQTLSSECAHEIIRENSLWVHVTVREKVLAYTYECMSM